MLGLTFATTVFVSDKAAALPILDQQNEIVRSRGRRARPRISPLHSILPCRSTLLAAGVVVALAMPVDAEMRGVVGTPRPARCPTGSLLQFSFALSRPDGGPLRPLRRLFDPSDADAPLRLPLALPPYECAGEGDGCGHIAEEHTARDCPAYPSAPIYACEIDLRTGVKICVARGVCPRTEGF
jgi:hypothetical protein